MSIIKKVCAVPRVGEAIHLQGCLERNIELIAWDDMDNTGEMKLVVFLEDAELSEDGFADAILEYEQNGWKKGLQTGGESE